PPSPGRSAPPPVLLPASSSSDGTACHRGPDREPFCAACELFPQHPSYREQRGNDHLETKVPSHELPDPLRSAPGSQRRPSAQIAQRPPQLVLHVLQLGLKVGVV